MTILPCPEDSANPDVAQAAREVISAATRFMAVATGSFAEREQELLDALQEGGRIAREQDLQPTEDALPAEVVVGLAQRIYREHQPGAATYLSVFGELRVQRRSFREVAVRNGPTVIALELCAGLMEGATPAFAYSVSERYGLHDMRKHQEVPASSRRHVPPRATLERLAMRLGTRIDEQVPAVEPIVRGSESIPPDTRALSLGLDRTSAPMAEPREKGARKKPRRTRKKPRVRAIPQPAWPVRIRRGPSRHDQCA